MDIVPPLLLQIILIVLNAIFASAEIAIISISEAKAQKMASDGNKQAKGLLQLIQNPAKLLATIQIAITLSGFLGSAFAAENFASMIMASLTAHGLVTAATTELWSNICVVIVTLLLSFVTLVFGELVPKRIAMHKAEGIALTLSGPLNLISKLFTPVVWFLTASTNLVLRMCGIDPHAHTEDVSEEDVRLMVDTSEDIEPEEKQMIRNVFEFNDITVNEFATHRTEVEYFWEDDDVSTWIPIILKSFHKFYPICDTSVDNIIGILDVKAYFALTDRADKEAIWATCIKKPFFVPETITANILFQQMKQNNTQVAIVLDEYGGVNGLVTFADILEQIVGTYNDTPEEPANIIPEDNGWKIIGATPISEVNAVLGTTFSEDEYETFGGMVFGQYGHVPDDDSQFTITIDNYNIEVKIIKDHKIEEAFVSLRPQDEPKGETT